MATSLEKGNALEAAVHMIEEKILQSSPALRENTFRIEGKKLVKVNNVRHELDLFVEVEIGAGYTTSFVFECKNWKTPVGKNEIIVFSEKIRAVQAQKGFFVAKSFTKDATAQADQDGRIELVSVAELPIDQMAVPYNFHYLVREKFDVSINIVTHDPSVSQQTLALDQAQATLDGAELDLDSYVKKWAEDTYNESIRTFPSVELPEGVHKQAAEAKQDFADREFVIDDMVVGALYLKVEFDLKIIRPTIVSYFDVGSRGRCLSLAPLEVGNSTLRVGFIEF